MQPAINQKRSRIQLVLLFILFCAPFLAAYISFYFMPQFMPKGRLNYGHLMSPTQILPVFALRDEKGQLIKEDLLRSKWILLHVVRKSCDDSCIKELILSRQTRAAMNRNDGRIRRVLLLAPTINLAELKLRLEKEHPDLHYAQDSLTPPFALQTFSATVDNAIMLIDPRGNWVMTYDPSTDAQSVQKDFKGLQKDLNKLLKLSHIG